MERMEMSDEVKELLDKCFAGKHITFAEETTAGEVVFHFSDGSSTLMQYPERANIYFTHNKAELK